MKMNNGVTMTQAPLQFERQPEPLKKYQVFPSGDRWVVGRMVYGAGNVLYDVVDDSRSKNFAIARAEALNSGLVKV